MSQVALWCVVGAVGGLGAILRFTVDGLISSRANRDFPLGTMGVNLSGAALLGGLAGAGLRGHALLVLGTGLLGSYTTFSTWMLETHGQAEAGDFAGGAINLVGSLLLGLGAAALGRLIADAL